MKDPLKALFGKPDYSRIVRDTTATISITAAEMAAVLEAHDRIDTLDGTRPRAAVELLGKLSFNARLSGEQRYHNTQLLHRKYKSQFKLKPPNVANPS